MISSRGFFRLGGMSRVGFWETRNRWQRGGPCAGASQYRQLRQSNSAVQRRSQRDRTMPEHVLNANKPNMARCKHVMHIKTDLKPANITGNIIVQ